MLVDKRDEAYLDRLHLSSSVRQVVKIRNRLNSEESITVAQARTLYDELRNRLLEELGERYFYYLPPGRAQLYMSPLEGWGNVISAFPATKVEIAEAQQCLALQKPTAAVFHSMRVLERGLRALASHLRVPMKKTKDVTWEKVIVQIEARIEGYRAKAGGPQVSSSTKARNKKAWTTYAPLALQFRFFKDVWRNHVMHDDASYNDAQAEGILRSVRDFMTDLSSHIVHRT